MKNKIIQDRISNKMTLQQLAKKYGIRWQKVKDILITNEAYKDSRHAPKTNEWNDGFFEKQSVTVAYWAGFCFADGCITMQRYGTRLHVTISEKDSEHIEQFAKTIEFPIEKIMKVGATRVLQVYSHGEDLSRSLAKFGIVKRKSYNFIEPQIPAPLIPHFLRGWFDGDGSMFVKPGNQRFEVVGNSYGIEWYALQLRKLGYSGHINIYGSEERVWRRLLVTGILQIKYIAELLQAYDDDLPRLDRKWLPILSK
jgi:hypothetical protein